MFEAALEAKFKQLFGVLKVDYSLPGESQEQECLFINVERAIPRISDGVQGCRVIGNITVFANADKMPYGYFRKRFG